MSSGFRQILAVLASLLFAISMPAQDIPVLPDDPAVLKGVTPNGLSYYLVSNKSVIGAADFALVQRNGSITDAREALLSLPRVKSQSPQDFLLRHGSAPGRYGYVKASDDAVVFRMENISLTSGRAVLDSTLLMIMDIVDKAYAQCAQILERDADKMRIVVEFLMEHETMTGSQFAQCMAGQQITEAGKTSLFDGIQKDEE